MDFPEALKCELVVTVTGRGITKKDWLSTAFTALPTSTLLTTSWRLQSPLKILVKHGNCPQVGVKINNIRNQHLDYEYEGYHPNIPVSISAFSLILLLGLDPWPLDPLDPPKFFKDFLFLKSFKKKKHQKIKKNKGKSTDICNTSFKGDGKFAKIFWALINC